MNQSTELLVQLGKETLIPILGFFIVLALLISTIQNLSRVHDHAFSVATKFFFLLLVCYIFGSSIAKSFTKTTTSIWKENIVRVR